MGYRLGMSRRAAGTDVNTGWGWGHLRRWAKQLMGKGTRCMRKAGAGDPVKSMKPWSLTWAGKQDIRGGLCIKIQSIRKVYVKRKNRVNI